MHHGLQSRVTPDAFAIEMLENRLLLAFVHPGILSTQADFDRMVTKVTANQQPWTSGYNALTSDGYSQLGWNPRPLQTVIRGGTGQNFNQMVIDMQRAFQTAVRWKVSGNTAYADQAVTILNAWSSTMTTLTGNSDRFLASGLYGFGWAASAEIMRTYSGWASTDVTAFQNYLLNIYYPMQHDFLTNHNDAYITNYWANWDLANIEGMMAVGIFADRQDIYDKAIDYLYTGGGNGALDKMAYYRHPGNLFQWQESGRDQGHTTLGMALMGHVAQMAWNQGLDLFSYNNYQLLGAAEYIAKYNLGFDVPYETYNWGNGQSGAFSSQTVLGWGSRGHGRPCYELIVSHYTDLLGMEAKYSNQRVNAIGTEWRGSGDEFGFGTLLYSRDSTTTPQPPRGLTAVEKGANNIQLDWFGGANNTSYSIYRATNSAGPFTQIAGGINDLLTYTDRNLPAGTYYYKVTGINGATETAASNVVMASARNRIVAQLPFNESSGTNAPDSTGNGFTGTLTGGASWSTGKTGNAVLLNGSTGYVDLLESPVEGLSDFTIATWVYLNSNNTWARIFDFGDSRGRWMFLTPKNGGGVPEFATSTVYGYNKQWITGNAAFPTNQWVHVAVTVADHVGTLYINGVAAGSNANIDFPPAIIGATANNWIGRSQFADPYLNGKVDDFRVYRGSLSAGEIYTQATGLAAPAVPGAPVTLTATAVVGNQINLSWSSVAGATGGYSVWRSTTSGGPYTAVATMVNGTTYSDTGRIAGQQYYYVVTAANNGGDSANSAQAGAVALPPMPGIPASLTAAANSPTSILLTWTAASNAASYTVKRSLSAGGPYTVVASGITATSYTNTGLTSETPYYYVVTAVNASGESSNSNEAGSTPTSLRARLTFNDLSGTTAPDVTGTGWNGTLINGPVLNTGKLSSAVDLDGTDDHVTLPAGVVNGLSDFTISAWVNPDTVSTWQRIFDFGTGTSNYMFLSTRGGSNVIRYGIIAGGGTEQQINGAAALTAGVWSHVAVTLNGSVGTLYVNGTAVGTNNAMTLTPSSLGATTQNYLGKSQFSADAYLNGRIDDFRIYSRALSAADVTTLKNSTIPAVPTGLAATAGNAQVSLNWNSVAGAAGYKLSRSTSSSGPFAPIAGALAGTSYVDGDVVNGTTYYYVVSAYNLVDGSSNSSSVNGTPVAPVAMTGSGFAYQTLPYQLSFTFDGSRSFSSADLTVTPAGGGTAIPASGYQWNSATNTATFDLPGPLPDGTYTASLPGGYSFNFFVLAGDANHSGTVDSIDFTTLLGNYGSDSDFGDGDFNYDGKVNTLDFNLLAGHFGQSATPAPALFSSIALEDESPENPAEMP